MMNYPRPMLWTGKQNLSLAASYMWFQVELAVFGGLLLSNATFLAIRSCIRHKIQLDEIPERKKLPNVDTILAIQEVANAFNAQMVPFIVSAFLYIQPNGTNGGFLFVQLTIILASNMISLFCITYLIFIPWKKGPAWYVKNSHVIVYILLMANYLVIPIGNLGIAMFFIIDPAYDLKNETVQSWVVFFNIVCVSRILEFFTMIKRTVLLDAKNYLAAKKALEE